MSDDNRLKYAPTEIRFCRGDKVLIRSYIKSCGDTFATVLDDGENVGDDGRMRYEVRLEGPHDEGYVMTCPAEYMQPLGPAQTRPLAQQR